MPKSKHQVPGGVRTAYEFIKANRSRYSVQAMCRVFEVAPTGYYEWLLQPISDRGQEDARLLRLIRASFTASHGIYGAPRVFLDLREAGETCSKHRVSRLMREANLRARHGYRTRRWSVGKPSVLIPNLLKRQFTVTRPNTAWVTDITYIRTWQGWLYLAIVRICFRESRRVVRRPHDSPRVGALCGAQGPTHTTPAPHDDSLGPGHSIWQRCVATVLSRQPPRAQHES